MSTAILERVGPRQASAVTVHDGQLPLLDREGELATLGRAIEATAAGDGRVLLIQGIPGAGKTRLLQAARQLSLDAGLRTLSARGSEMEREYPYGCVRQLFEAAVFEPGNHGLFDGPAAAASTVFMPQSTVDPSAFATLSGLYWLTANAAAQEPLVLIIDDLHWTDLPSLGFVQFLLRRLKGLPVLLIVAARPEETEVLADVSASPAAIELHPAALSTVAVRRLTELLLGVLPADRFVAACCLATGGNPLLLVELLRTLRAEGIAPTDERVAAVDHILPTTLARVALLRLRALSGDARALARAIAALGSGTPALAADLAGIGAPAAARATEALTAAEVLDPAPSPGFVHSVVRDAIYHDLTPLERDQTHARAAELLHARAATAEQIGAHLLMTTPAGLPWASAVLQTAAADASHRGAADTAITYLRRAVDERPGDADVELLFRLGMTEAAIDPAAAIGHLRAAHRAARDAITRARIGETMTRVLVFFDPAEAIQTARETRAELPVEAEHRRVGLLAMERYAGRFGGMQIESHLGSASEGPHGRMLRAVQAWERCLSGGTALECAGLAAGLLGFGDASPQPTPTQETIFTAMLASAVLIFADDPRAEAFWDGWHLSGQPGGGLSAESETGFGRGHIELGGGIAHGAMSLRRGQLADAEAALRAATTGAAPAHVHATLAGILIARGELSAAEAVLEQEPQGLSPLTSEGALLCHCVSLQLLVARGHHQAALDGFDRVLHRLETVLNPVWAGWRLIRAEALTHVGRVAEARSLITEQLRLARHWGTPGPIGRALTLLGVLDGHSELLEEAVQVTQDPFARLEHAEALLSLGRHIRQAGRPKEARALLRDAHDLAARCGAEPLAKRAREELATAGGRPRARTGSGLSTLTPSERRAAELAASGHSNRDVAQQLHLSPKTVEVHLSSAYRKLGIRTRTDLPSALGPPTRNAA